MDWGSFDGLLIAYLKKRKSIYLVQLYRLSLMFNGEHLGFIVPTKLLCEKDSPRIINRH
jgi:hypothetical protein